jgi:hypothetical protein
MAMKLGRPPLSPVLQGPIASPIGAGLGGLRLGGGPGLPTIQPLSAYWEEETTAFATAAGITDEAQIFAIDYGIKIWKRSAWFARWKAATNTGIYLWCAGSKSVGLVNMVHPGTRDLTEQGTVTFTAFDGVSSSGAGNHLRSGMPLNGFAQDSMTIGGVCTTNNAGATGAYDMGAIDGSSNGTRLMVRSTANLIAGAVNCAAAAFGATTDHSLPGARSLRRTAGANFNTFNYGVKRLTQATASVSISSTNDIWFLQSNGTSVVSQQSWSMFWVGDGLSDEEMANLNAGALTMANMFRFGLPKFQPAGYGDATPTYDVVIYGATRPGIIAAYECKRLGLSVCLVSDHLQRYVTDIGGHYIGWVDATIASQVKGFFRTLITYANLIGGATDSQDQNGLSVLPDLQHKAHLRALDPNRTGSTFDGADIPVYFSEGVLSVQMEPTVDGPKINGFTTADGRVFTANVGVIGADYDGHILPLASIPYTQGTEAAGGGQESINGYDPTRVRKIHDGTSLIDVDPYVTPGDAGSGLIADTVPMPSITAGAADPILQAMNHRLVATSSASIMVPWTGTYALVAPPNYDPARYEGFARAMAAATALGHTFGLDDLVTLNSPLTGRVTRTDVNNSSSGISTDMPQSGEAYLLAADYAAEQAVCDEVRDYQRGLFYWVLTSGDSRIPAGLITALQGWGLAADHFLDTDVMYWPGLAYRRDPKFQMNNAGFRLSANGVWATDGTTPTSTKTIATASYDADRHAPRRVNDGGVIKTQGGYGLDGGVGGPGGADFIAPIPMEVVMPDKAACINYLTPTHPSWTKLVHSVGRMEFTLGLMAQACGFIMKARQVGDIPVQDVDYDDDVRTPFLATSDPTPNLPQEN